MSGPLLGRVAIPPGFRNGLVLTMFIEQVNELSKCPSLTAVWFSELADFFLGFVRKIPAEWRFRILAHIQCKMKESFFRLSFVIFGV